MIGAGRNTALLAAPDRARALARAGFPALVLTATVVAAACSYSTTGRFFNQIAVAVGAVALVLAVLVMGGTGGGWSAYRRWPLVASALLSVAVQLYKPPIGNVQRALVFPAVLAVSALATLAIAVLAGGLLDRFGKRLTERGVLAVLVVLGVCELAIVASSHHPAIDVWQIFQQAAAGLGHGVNPYAVSYQHIPAGQTAGCFNYLPVTFLSVWPSWAVADDARYAEVAVLLAGWAVLARTILRRSAGEPRLRALLLLAVAVSLTGALRVGQQAWNESLLLGFLLLACCALLAGRAGWAVLLLGLALATKQHIALLLPVFVLWPGLGWRRTGGAVAVAAAVSAPWVFWNFGRFKGCTVDFFVHGVARFDSISLWHFVPSPVAPVVPVLAVLGAYLLVYRRVPRSPGGLLIGCALVLYAFNLFNKQSFENQWWFTAELLLCGLALLLARPAADRAAEPAPVG